MNRGNGRATGRGDSHQDGSHATRRGDGRQDGEGGQSGDHENGMLTYATPNGRVTNDTPPRENDRRGGRRNGRGVAA